MKHTVIAVLLGAAVLLPMSAQAQLHDGDIEMSVVNSQIVLSGNDAFHRDGSPIFEGDFGDLAGGPFKTDDPGFDSEAGTFAAGTRINYRALGSLQFWNGMAWSAAVPNSEFVQVEGNLGEASRWLVGGLSGDLSGLIGQAGSGGLVHEHLDISVGRPGGAPAVGAYLIHLQLTSASLTSSVPYYLALNQGLSSDNFEGAIGALAPVPEPETWWLMGVGLAAVGWRLRRTA